MQSARLNRTGERAVSGTVAVGLGRDGLVGVDGDATAVDQRQTRIFKMTSQHNLRQVAENTGDMIAPEQPDFKLAIVHLGLGAEEQFAPGVSTASS